MSALTRSVAPPNEVSARRAHHGPEGHPFPSLDVLALGELGRVSDLFGFGVLDADLRYVYVNRTLAEINGRAAEDHVGRTVEEVVPHLWPALEPSFRRVLDCGETITDSVVSGMTSADRHRVRHLRRMSYPLRVGTEVVGIGVVVVDITEHQEDEKRFHTVVDTLVDPLLILRPVRDSAEEIVDWECEYANPAGCDLLGVERGTSAGRRVRELAPEVGESVMQKLGAVLRSGIPLHDNLGYTEDAGDDRHIEGTVVALDDSIVVNVRDRTEEYRARTALEASERRFAALIQNSTDIILVVDRSGEVLYVSPAVDRVLGYSPEDVRGNVADFLHPDDLPAFARHLADTCAHPGVSSVHGYRVRGANGRWRSVESQANNLLDDPAVRGVIVNIRDVTEQEEATGAIANLNRVLRTVASANDLVVHADSEDYLLDEMCRRIVTVGGYARAWIGTPRGECPGQLRPVADHGGAAGYVGAVISASEGRVDGPATRAVATGTVQVVNDFRDLPDSPLRSLTLQYGYCSQIALPLTVGDSTFGALSILSTRVGAFDADELHLFEQVAANLAFGIASLRTRAERQEYFAQVTANLSTMTATIAAAVEQRDAYTAGHQRRVAQLSAAIGEEMGLDVATIAGIETAASIHDLGKLSVPAEILNRTGKLTAPEMELVKGHSEAGYQILAQVPAPWPLATMVLQHHERLDGSGYPAGLRGDEILLGARVIGVADTVEAMASYRPYRPRKSLEEAVDEIQRGRGVLYDPAVVDACLRLLAQGRLIDAFA